MSNFEVNPANYLGFEYEEYKNDLYALPLSKPSEYFELRKAVLKSVKTDAIGDIYGTFSKILGPGQNNAKTEIIKTSTSPANHPNYPAQEISKIALKAARTLDEILNEVIEIIFPSNFKQLANTRAVQKSEHNI